MSIQGIFVHGRGPTQSSLVYPVLSRRSGGLSLGINLFPDRKRCGFDCPYCEVGPFEGGAPYSAGRLETELEDFFTLGYTAGWAPRPLRDICFSGNGEPTLSPDLWEALELCAASRRRHADIAGSAPTVIITNSTGFLDAGISRRLAAFAAKEPLKIWAKLDAGSQERFEAMSGSGFQIGDIVSAIGGFARSTPLVIQTMVCGLGGSKPDDSEALAYASRVNAMLKDGAMIEAIHVYTVARVPRAAWASPLTEGEILGFMGRVASALDRPLPISGYGSGEGELLLEP